MTITSTHNDKLKLIRKLQQRKHREREGLFIGEGEDLVSAALEAGWEPVELLTAAGEDLDGIEVEPELLAGVSTLGSGTRAIGVWRRKWAEEIVSPCVYLHGLADPGNVGAVIRTARALVGGTAAIGPGSADPFSPRAVRASMGAIFSQPVFDAGEAGLGETPRPRAALLAHGGDALDALEGAATVVLGSERAGLPDPVLSECDAQATIALRPGAESLNVAAAAAIALQRISSRAMPGREAEDMSDD
jgi:TrmH family RNA methyltransferase